MRDWDATTYDRVSDPQVEMARAVLERLPLDGGETVLDAGCGSGRVTRLLAERLPSGRVVAVDGSPSMVAEATAGLADLGDRVETRVCDLVELELGGPVDAVFSNAVFHWIADHERLFGTLAAALAPGGRLVAQCGGAGNVERFDAAAREVAEHEPYAEHLSGWEGPWNFAGAEETAGRLDAAGFVEVRTWLAPWPVRPPEPVEYLRTICLGHHLEALPQRLRRPYAEAVAARCGEPLELDYVRLNIDATRAGATAEEGTTPT